jgi:hypothetical protein
MKNRSLEHTIRNIVEMYGSGTAKMGQEGKHSGPRINPEYSSKKTRGHGAASDTSRAKMAQSETATKNLKAEEVVIDSDKTEVSEVVGVALRIGSTVARVLSPRAVGSAATKTGRRSGRAADAVDTAANIAGAAASAAGGAEKPKSPTQPTPAVHSSGPSTRTFDVSARPQKQLRKIINK